MKVFSAIYVLTLVLASHLAIGQDFLIEQDLHLDWTFYNQDQEEVLPFLDNSEQLPFAIHLISDLDFGKETMMKLEIQGETSLFIDTKFMFHYVEPKIELFLLDSLRQASGKEQVYITLFNKSGFESPPKASIGFLHRSFDTAMNVNPVLFRDYDSKYDYLKIIILLIFTFFVVLHTVFPSEILDFYSFSSLVTFRYTATYLTKFRTITKTQILVIIYQAAMLSSIMIISLHYYNNPLGDNFILKINPVIGWLIVLMITLALIFLKYILINVISHLFGLADRVNFYFMEYLRMAMLFYTLVFIVICYTVINHFHSLNSLLNALIFIVIAFNFIRFLIIYFKFQRNISIKNLHLFSYLCSTELIPIVVGLNFFVK